MVQNVLARHTILLNLSDTNPRENFKEELGDIAASFSTEIRSEFRLTKSQPSAKR